jgi:hypothetical protein
LLWQRLFLLFFLLLVDPHNEPLARMEMTP